MTKLSHNQVVDYIDRAIGAKGKAPTPKELALMVLELGTDLRRLRESIQELKDRIKEDADPESGNSAMDEDDLKDEILKLPGVD